jgi:phosphopantetheine--protein transferase-like protein
MAQQKVSEYLSRLMGGRVTADQMITLSSAQKAAFASWLRREAIASDFAMVNRGAFTIAGLLNGPRTGGAHEDSVPVATTLAIARPVIPPGSGANGSIGGIGIDIEELDTLPDAEDYREHEFYRDNFSPAEIAYCIQQPAVKTSFCGLWAAKEAVIKSGAASNTFDGLRSIEIARDGAGRPMHPGCMLSISHSARTAVAVCVWSRASSDTVSVLAEGGNQPQPSLVGARAEMAAANRPSRLWLLLGALAVLIAAAALHKLLLV